jgi:S1-C subfamily serine protease
MKMRNEPTAYGFLAGMIVLLLGLVVANCSCYAGMRTRVRITQEYSSAVEITVTCFNADASTTTWFGSGVIVDAAHVLTAGHVADARDAMCSYTVEAEDGKQRSMYVKTLLKDVDLARLELSISQEPFAAPPVRFGPKPLIGTQVCTATAHPHRMRKCGEVQPYKWTPGDLVMTMVVEPGNSGSGLYDEEGQLVGIVTHSTGVRTTSGAAAARRRLPNT